jgi:nucleotide-binding universal stress UspA family protein
VRALSLAQINTVRDSGCQRAGMQDADLLLQLPRPSSTPDPIAIRNILVATDFSDCSKRALGYALGIASRYESQLHLFHCIDPMPYNLIDPAAVQTACDNAHRELEQVASDLRREERTGNVKLNTLVSAGEIISLLTDAVKNLNVDLIIVGTHGRTGWRKAVLGSVTELVVDQSSCPVLSVGRFADRIRIQEFGPESILLAYGASVRSRLAESYAVSLARKYNSRLSVVGVLDDKGGRVLAQVSQLKWFEHDVRSTALDAPLTIPPQLPIDIDAQSDLILQVADQTAADLIVLAVPATHRFSDRFVSTNSYRVVCGARCPVLTVHAQDL